MQFAESTEGEYRIYVGALEAPQGDGYIAALVVKHRLGEHLAGHASYRDNSVACGYRWPSPDEAITYAMARGREFVRRRCGEIERSAVRLA